jgi:hypothetical protein
MKPVIRNCDHCLKDTNIYRMHVYNYDCLAIPENKKNIIRHGFSWFFKSAGFMLEVNPNEWIISCNNIDCINKSRLNFIKISGLK